MSQRYQKGYEPWLPLAGHGIPESTKPASRKQMRHATRIVDKDAWREYRRERKAWHMLERMRKVYDRRVARGEVNPSGY